MNSNGIYVTVELYLFQVFVCFDSLMENVRVRRAGFVFRQEYEVALERYGSFCFSFSQAIGVHWYTTLLVSFRTRRAIFPWVCNNNNPQMIDQSEREH